VRGVDEKKLYSANSVLWQARPGQKTLFLNGAEDIFPEYTIGQDGVAFSLPANSDDIIRTSEGL
jgi:hypothetical protein